MLWSFEADLGCISAIREFGRSVVPSYGMLLCLQGPSIQAGQGALEGKLDQWPHSRCVLGLEDPCNLLLITTACRKQHIPDEVC